MSPGRWRAACVVAAVSAMPWLAHAQDVHKCVDNGHVTFQSGPCAHGDTVVHVRSMAPTASDAEAAASRAQAQKEAVLGRAPTDAGVPADNGAAAPAAAATDACKPLNQRYRDALASQDAVNHQATKVSPGGKAMANVDDAREQARRQVQDAESQLRAANCRVARP